MKRRLLRFCAQDTISRSEILELLIVNVINILFAIFSVISFCVVSCAVDFVDVASETFRESDCQQDAHSVMSDLQLGTLFLTF